MTHLSNDDRRHVFAMWLRTGKVPIADAASADGVEFKFNPYHDPRNGRFTFAPGGVAGLANDRFRRSAPTRVRRADRARSADDPEEIQSVGTLAPAARQARPPTRPGPAMGRGSNSRAFEDPMTLEQSFPGLQGSPGGTILAVADNLFDFTGPANRSMMEFLHDQSKRLTAQIRSFDPKWHYDESGPTDAFGTPIVTLQGLSVKVNDLRFQRAAIIARIQGDYRPLQVETLRFVQQQTDKAYEDGMALLKAGRLSPRLSEREALGNYIDRRVREDLRERYNQLGIDSAGKGPVRVNRREDDSSGTDTTYRRPDSRVKDVAFDVTLTHKTLGTAQVRGFFNTDFRPSQVIIIRPRQLGINHTYVISRPETKR